MTPVFELTHETGGVEITEFLAITSNEPDSITFTPTEPNPSSGVVLIGSSFFYRTTKSYAVPSLTIQVPRSAYHLIAVDVVLGHTQIKEHGARGTRMGYDRTKGLLLLIDGGTGSFPTKVQPREFLPTPPNKAWVSEGHVELFCDDRLYSSNPQQQEADEWMPANDILWLLWRRGEP